MPLNGTKVHRFSALMDVVFIGMGSLFLIWGATDIIFPITEVINVAVFGLMQILLGVVSISIVLGAEVVQWAKIENQNP